MQTIDPHCRPAARGLPRLARGALPLAALLLGGCLSSMPQLASEMVRVQMEGGGAQGMGQAGLNAALATQGVPGAGGAPDLTRLAGGNSLLGAVGGMALQAGMNHAQAAVANQIAGRQAGAMGSGAALMPGSTEAAPAAAPLPEVEGLFKRQPPQVGGRAEAWPKVALTIKAVSPRILAHGPVAALAPDDCMVYDLRIWRSAAESERLDQQQLCAGALDRSAQSAARAQAFVRLTAARGDTHTGTRRSDGPAPPLALFPPQQATALRSGTLPLYLGTLLQTLGFVPNGSDRRLWVVELSPGPM